MWYWWVTQAWTYQIWIRMTKRWWRSFVPTCHLVHQWYVDNLRRRESSGTMPFKHRHERRYSFYSITPVEGGRLPWRSVTRLPQSHFHFHCFEFFFFFFLLIHQFHAKHIDKHVRQTNVPYLYRSNYPVQVIDSTLNIPITIIIAL